MAQPGCPDHAEGVPFATGEGHLGIDKGSSSTREASPLDQCRDRARGAVLIFFHKANGLLRFGESVTQQA